MAKAKGKALPKFYNPPFTRGEAASIERAAKRLGISGYRFVAVAAVEMARRLEGTARPRG